MSPTATCGRPIQELPWRSDGTAQQPMVLNTGAEITTAATTWLEGLAPDDAFFLFLHYYDVHNDYAPGPRFRTLLGAGPDLQPGSSTFLINRRDGATLTPAEHNQMQRLYDAEIRQLDGHLGSLFDALQRLELWDRTLVLVTSDHGEEFQEHGRLLHGRAVYEETMHVPLLMRGPGVPRGQVVTQLTSHVDITPTILAATTPRFVARALRGPQIQEPTAAPLTTRKPPPAPGRPPYRPR